MSIIYIYHTCIYSHLYIGHIPIFRIKICNKKSDFSHIYCISIIYFHHSYNRIVIRNEDAMLEDHYKDFSYYTHGPAGQALQYHTTKLLNPASSPKVWGFKSHTIKVN
jgi:hypothetical protein